MAVAMTAERVATAAAAWNYARQRAIQLRSDRAAIECDREAQRRREFEAWDAAYGHLVDDFVGGLSPKHPDIPDPPESGVDEPCWKIWLDPAHGDDDRRRLPLEQWCVACRRRQEVHLAFRAANREHGTLLRTLMRYAGAWPAPQTVRPAAYQRAMGARTL